MTEITKDHVEWAVVERLRCMLESPRHPEFNVTETFAIYSSILCWVLQHVRIGEGEQKTLGDSRAAGLVGALKRQSIQDEPWRIPLLARVAGNAAIPEAHGFDTHDVFRFLKNLRDSVAHGDARKVEPFHSKGSGADRQLLGFTFRCAEHQNREWSGKITLLESDMRRIATILATLYCDMVSGRSEGFAEDVHRHVKETAV